MGLKKAIKKAYKQTANQVDDARDPNQGVWGDNEYARLAERLSGASTFKSAISERQENYNAKGGFSLQGDVYKDTRPLIGGVGGHDAKDAARQGRPAMAYKDTVTARPVREAQADQERRDSEFASQQALLDRQSKEFASGQIAARARRRFNRGANKGVKAQALGSNGNAEMSFGSLLGV